MFLVVVNRDTPFKVVIILIQAAITAPGASVFIHFRFILSGHSLQVLFRLLFLLYLCLKLLSHLQIRLKIGLR